MNNLPDRTDEDPKAFDPAIQSEKIAFAPGELVSCDACSRQNPPNRTHCLYCGKELEFRAEDLDDQKPVARALESWEAGFNVIFRSALSNCDVSAANVLLSENSELAAIVRSGIPMPIARVESLKLAEILADKLKGVGIDCIVVGDADLDVERPPVRLSKVAVAGGHFEFTDFNTHSTVRIAFSDLTLIVTGQLNRTRTDLIEKRKRKGPELLDETASFADETLLDLYTTNDIRGYRIFSAGFDFSCLGDKMSLLARENMDRLITYLSDSAPSVIVVTNYAAARRYLAPFWEIETRSDAQGIKRIGFGKLGFGKTESTSNLQQFTKYSRLQRHLL
ncbi:MAG: hypothetical protein IPG67_16710 [Acidobacteria bacterium]|nr:hypothetical protein [Acidobacteriota bacterium]